MNFYFLMYIVCYMNRLIIALPLILIVLVSHAEIPKDVVDLCNNDIWEAYKYAYSPHLVSNSPSELFQYRDGYCKNVGKTAWLKKSLPNDPPLGTIKGAFLAIRGQYIETDPLTKVARNSWWYIIEDKSVSPEPWLMSVDKVEVKN